MSGVTYEHAVAVWLTRSEFAHALGMPKNMDPALVSDVQFDTEEGSSCPTCGYGGSGVVRFSYDGREYHSRADEMPFAKLVGEIVAVAVELEAARS